MRSIESIRTIDDDGGDVRCRFNYKALAKEVGSSKPSVVGGYLLCHWRRYGLDDYFRPPPQRPSLMRKIDL